jgi:hypothetical protein
MKENEHFVPVCVDWRQLRLSRWLCVLMLLFMVSVSMLAQSQQDVITFTGGTESTEYPGVYVIDVGDLPAHPQKDDEGYDIPDVITVTLSRPQGASATRAASISLKNMYYDEAELVKVTFEPGEMTKTVQLTLPIDPTDGYMDENDDWVDIYTWSGNIPVLYSVESTSHADAAYELLMLRINRTGADAPRESSYATKLEVLQDTYGNDRAYYAPQRWGEYMLFRFYLSTDVKIANDSRYVINARFTDHTNLDIDADDYGLAQSHEVELHPINAGSICDQVWCLYRPNVDEYLHSMPGNDPEYSSRGVVYPILEVGPFEVANPTEDAVKYIFYSRSDLPENSANSNFPIYMQHDRLMAKFSNIQINKTSFKSGETIIITATMDNWKFVKRGQANEFRMSFGATLDDNKTVVPRHYTFDEETGLVTYYITAPTVTEPTTLYVDFGPVVRPVSDNMTGYYSEVRTDSKGWFKVTVSPEQAAPKPVTQMDFVGLPAEGSVVVLKHKVVVSWPYQWDDVQIKEFPFYVTCLPIDATNSDPVTLTITNSDDAQALLMGDGYGGNLLYTGKYEGTVTVTATLPSGFSISRTFRIKWGNYDEEELAMPEPMNHTNSYYMGTTFPLFQFELKNPDNWPLDDEVTVNYTTVNGLQWTEIYSLKNLKSEQTDRGTVCYNLPFSFNEEHPDASTDDQIGQTVVTAQVLLSVPTTDGTKENIQCMATLTSDLKKPSFGDYSEMTAYHNEACPVTLTSEVMYLPLKGFTVGYEIPELGILETYNNKSGEPIPDWLELQEDAYYCTAYIKVHPTPDPTITRYTLYTLAQRSYNPDEVMMRELTCMANLTYADAKDFIVYRVNDDDVPGDLIFDNQQGLSEFTSQMQTAGVLWSENMSFNNSTSDYPADVYDQLFNLLRQTHATFELNDLAFDGAEVVLTCDGDTIQTLTHYTGRFSFIPPSDGRTYEVEVYFPGFNKRYKNTFVSGKLDKLYVIKSYVSRFYPLMTGPYSAVSRNVELLYADGDENRNIQYNSGKYQYASSACYGKIKGFLYAENPHDFMLRDIPATGNVKKTSIRMKAEDFLIPIEFKAPAELIMYNHDPLFSFDTKFMNKFHTNWTNLLYWDEMTSNVTQVTVVDSQGQTVDNAELHYACVDNTMTIQDDAGTATFDTGIDAYQINTDSKQFAQLIEVVAPGYQPMLTTMYLWNYDYTSRENSGKVRRHTIVLHQNEDQLKSLTLETPKRSGNMVNNVMVASINADDLLMMDPSQKLDYSQTADYETAIKKMSDAKFGDEGWSGTKYAHLTGFITCGDNFDASQLTLEGVDAGAPVSKLISKSDFTTFANNYCFFDFDLTDQIAADATAQPVLKNGTETLAELPALHNHTIDLAVLNEENNIQMPFNTTDVKDVDNQASAQGVNMKDTGKAFDKFNFQVPPILPFTVNIERNGDYFLVRAVCEVNFLPSGPIMNALDKLDNLKYFDEQYQACMDAVNSAKPMDDDFFNDIPRWPSAFVGIKGFLSGIGTINHDTGKLEINFYDGGVTFEASASARASVSFGIGSFGMSVDAKIAMTMALVNHAAALGEVGGLPKIDFMLDNQFHLKVCAWAEAGIDIWIAKAAAGVRGGASIDIMNRSVVPFYSGGSNAFGAKFSLRAAMEAYAEVRFLFFKKKKSWKILDARKEWLTPNDPSNPFHPSFDEPIFEVSQRNVTKGYKKLKRKVIADLGTPIINNVSGMARPTYMMGGQSLLFNNLKDADDYNDDRLQVYANGDKNDLVSTDINAPMYDFSTDGNQMIEAVAFEQLGQAIDKAKLDAMSEQEQTKTVTNNSEVRVAFRQNHIYDDDDHWDDWQTQTLGSNRFACVNPVVAATNDWLEPGTYQMANNDQKSHAAAIWQQGTPKFNDEGDRYIDGSLMLSRYNRDDKWCEPIEIKRLNRRSVPADYQMVMKSDHQDGDSILVMMTLKQDVNNTDKGASVVFVSVTPDDKVRERYTQVEGSKPQMVHVDGINLVGYLKQNEDGRDIELRTVNMKGEPAGKISSHLGMTNRMVNDFRLILDRGATDLTDVALLWSQSDEVQTPNTDGTTTVTYKNRIYASKLCSHDKKLYFSTPVEVATMPDDVTLVSMDGYLSELNMKVVYCVANENEGAAVLETPVVFTNAIDHKVSFNPYEVTDNQLIPVTITVANNGFEPIERIDVTMGGDNYRFYTSLMPQETTDVTVDYPVPDDFDGTISYDVAATFTIANSNSLKVRRKAAARPRRISQSGTQTDIRQVDMAAKIVSKRIDNDQVTIIAEVNNASLLPLSSDVAVKVGLYNSPLSTEKIAGSTEVTVSNSDLYDASTKSNKVKLVTLTATVPDFGQTVYLRTTPQTMVNGQWSMVSDVRPSNNVLPVKLAGQYLLGDANGDKKVTITDAVAVVNYILGNPSNNFKFKAANVNRDSGISITDAVGIVNIILNKSASAPAMDAPAEELETEQEPE